MATTNHAARDASLSRETAINSATDTSGRGVASANDAPATRKRNPTKTATTTATKTLGSLLHYFEGIELIVELKTGKMYRGILRSVDSNIDNVILDNAYDIHAQQQQQQEIATTSNIESMFLKDEAVEETAESNDNDFATKNNSYDDDECNNHDEDDMMMMSTITYPITIDNTNKPMDKRHDKDDIGISSGGDNPTPTNATTSSTSATTTTATTSSTTICIRGSKIRYIHFPEDLDLTGHIKVGIDRERSAKNMYKRGKRK